MKKGYKKAHACAATGPTHGGPRPAVLLIGFPFFPKKKKLKRINRCSGGLAAVVHWLREKNHSAQ